MHTPERHGIIPKHYLVTHYSVTYKTLEGENTILMPNRFRQELDGHAIRKLAIKKLQEELGGIDFRIVRIEKHGDCVYCGNFGKLERSHVIGNTVFSKILKDSENGHAIKISLSAEQKIGKSNDSWAKEMLCNTCESKFNSEFENYSIYLLREKQPGVIVSKFSSGVSFQKVDTKKIFLYVLSILWRAAYSDHKAYANVIINYGMDSYLRWCFQNNRKTHSLTYSIKISKLVDKTNYFNEKKLRNFIFNPFVRKIDNKNASYCMLYEGYFFEVFLKALPFKQRNGQGFIDFKKNILFVPYIDVFDIPEVYEYFGRAVAYHHATNPPCKANPTIRKS